MSSASFGYPSGRPQTPRRNVVDSLMSHVDPVVHKHLRRVYTSLTSALCVATVGAFLALYLVHRGSYWLSSLCSLAVIPTLVYFNFMSPHSPRRSFVFHLFAFVDGCTVGPLLNYVSDVDPAIPPLAFLGATLVFACCSISAIFARRKSYLFLSSFLFTALFGMCLVVFLGRAWPNIVPVMPFLYLGLVLFCGFVLYDTQMIIEKAHAGDRDHLKHALELFIDFVAIVRHVMVIMAKNRQRRESEDDQRSKSRRN